VVLVAHVVRYFDIVKLLQTTERSALEPFTLVALFGTASRPEFYFGCGQAKLKIKVFKSFLCGIYLISFNLPSTRLFRSFSSCENPRLEDIENSGV
jgi:hypothetical protein